MKESILRELQKGIILGARGMPALWGKTIENSGERTQKKEESKAVHAHAEKI